MSITEPTPRRLLLDDVNLCIAAVKEELKNYGVTGKALMRRGDMRPVTYPVEVTSVYPELVVRAKEILPTVTNYATLDQLVATGLHTVDDGVSLITELNELKSTK